jgi:hypothetical protein
MEKEVVAQSRYPVPYFLLNDQIQNLLIGGARTNV